MKRRFWKMSGAGNDFVLLEGPVGARLQPLARKLCDRRRGIGADGLLLVTRRGLSLRYLNADGSDAFCGNGSRCAAWWMHARGWTCGRRRFELLTNEGTLRARILPRGRAAVAMPAARLIKGAFTVDACGRPWSVAHWDTGVPHAVVAVDDVDAVAVEDVGRALRHHPAFGAAGANVDFMQKRGGVVAIRTYERGVEGETLACGTGAVACAAAAQALGWVKPPVRLAVRSGDVLTVDEQAWLEGPAEICFTGEIEI